MSPRPTIVATSAQRPTRRSILAAMPLLAFSLAGCGGGGGGGGGSGGGVIVVPTPPTPPPPPPPPPPPAAGPPFGALGQTTSQQFAVLGFSYRADDNGFGFSPEAAPYNWNQGVGLRLLAPSQLLLTVDGFGEGVLVPNGGGGTDGQGRTTQLSYSALGGDATLQLALRRDGSYMTSTALGIWILLQNRPSFPYFVVEFLYGVPTAAAEMPQTGSALFEAVRETVQSFTVDFGARTVTGTITAQSTQFVLSDVVFTGDGTSFRGRLVPGGVAQEGVIEGRFTGPAAREMMVRFVIPSQIGPLSFLWVAARA